MTRIKITTNKARHEVDFDEAQALWDGPERVEIPARQLDEPRYLMIGKIDSKYWSVAMTYRGGNIHLISVRRSRAEGGI